MEREYKRNVLFLMNMMILNTRRLNQKDAADLMEQIRKCNESKENPPTKDSIGHDALARVLGPEARGRVRGLGFGATPSRVAATVQNNAVLNEIQTRMGMFQAKLEWLEKENQIANKNLEEMMSSKVATPQSDQGSHVPQDQPSDNQMC